MSILLMIQHQAAMAPAVDPDISALSNPCSRSHKVIDESYMPWDTPGIPIHYGQ